LENVFVYLKMDMCLILKFFLRWIPIFPLCLICKIGGYKLILLLVHTFFF
jgi:hypothetical protein